MLADLGFQLHHRAAALLAHTCAYVENTVYSGQKDLVEQELVSMHA